MNTKRKANIDQALLVAVNVLAIRIHKLTKGETDANTVLNIALSLGIEQMTDDMDAAESLPAMRRKEVAREMAAAMQEAARLRDDPSYLNGAEVREAAAHVH